MKIITFALLISLVSGTLTAKDNGVSKNVSDSVSKNPNDSTITGTKESIGPISVEFPAAWVKKKSKMGSALLYRSPTTHKAGGISCYDIFYVRVTPGGNATLAMMKSHLSEFLKQSAQKINSQLKKAGVNKLKNIELSKFDKPIINEIKIDGTPALEIKNHSVLMYKGQVVKKVCRSIFILIDNKFYSITANYDEVQEKTLKPLSDKFLKSIKIKKIMRKKSWTKENKRSEWNQKEAEKLIGKYVLVGITYVDSNNHITERKQLHGVIKTVLKNKGILVSLKGVNEGQEYNLPPDYSNFKKAIPGSYHLHSTNEDIKDPDFTVTWTINSN